MKKVQYTSQKLILSGNVFELYSFEMPILIDPIPQNKKRFVTSGIEPRKERRFKKIKSSKSYFGTLKSKRKFWLK